MLRSYAGWEYKAIELLKALYGDSMSSAPRAGASHLGELMKITRLSIFAFLFALCACAEGAAEGEECTADADCAEGLECHMHDGEEDHGECEAHDEDEE